MHGSLVLPEALFLRIHIQTEGGATSFPQRRLATQIGAFLYWIDLLPVSKHNGIGAEVRVPP